MSSLYIKHRQGEQSDHVDPSNMNRSVPAFAPREWDPSFHGSVHTATIAVCIVLVIFVVILGTFGNGLVLLSALRCKKLRSNFDVFIFNLAGADFIVCSCLSPTFLYLLFSDPPSPGTFCGGFLFSCTACGLLSLLTLVAIAVHRHSRVRKVRGALTTTKTALILLAIYLVSLSSAIGGTLHVTLGWKATDLDCQSVMNGKDIYSNNVVLFFVSPVVLVGFVAITASYVIIARAVRLQTLMRTRSLQPVVKSTVCKPFQTNLDPNISPSDIQNTVRYSHSSTKRHNGKSAVAKHCSCCSCATALDRENKAVSMCFVVILIITLCWMPLVFSHIVELVTGESIVIYQVKLCGIALVFLNSALDPYMYAQNSGRIKQRYGRIFWDMLRCECSAPSKQKIPILSPGFVTQRVTRNTVISPDGATLQFLQPKSRKPRIRKQCVRLESPTKRYRAGKFPYNSASLVDNKLLVKGKSAMTTSQSQSFRDAKTSKKQQCSQTGVKSLVQKTCCHANVPDDQSLIDS